MAKIHGIPLEPFFFLILDRCVAWLENCIAWWLCFPPQLLVMIFYILTEGFWHVTDTGGLPDYTSSPGCCRKLICLGFPLEQGFAPEETMLYRCVPGICDWFFFAVIEVTNHSTSSCSVVARSFCTFVSVSPECFAKTQQWWCGPPLRKQCGSCCG